MWLKKIILVLYLTILIVLIGCNIVVVNYDTDEVFPNDKISYEYKTVETSGTYSEVDFAPIITNLILGDSFQFGDFEVELGTEIQFFHYEARYNFFPWSSWEAQDDDAYAFYIPITITSLNVEVGSVVDESVFDLHALTRFSYPNDDETSSAALRSKKFFE